MSQIEQIVKELEWLEELENGGCGKAYMPKLNTEELGQHLKAIREFHLGDTVEIAKSTGDINTYLFAEINYPRVHCTYQDEDGENCSFITPIWSVMTDVTKAKLEADFPNNDK